MSSLPVPSHTVSLTRAERRVAREIAQARAASTVLAAREAAKVDAIATVAESAVVAAYDLTCLELALVARTPAFGPRAAVLNDGAVIGMRGVLTRMSRSL
jgi:hypothetical protein